jgi:Putative beta barrel porin-7 (BBP7)
LPAPFDERLHGGLRPGYRLGVGGWLDRDRTWGVGADFFQLETAGREEVLAVPNPLVPGTVGSVNFSAGSRLLGAEVDGRRRLYCRDDFRVELLAGYRYLRLSEDLTVGAGLPGGPTAEVEVATLNQFHGGQFGVEGEYRYGRWYLDLLGKLGMGATFKEIDAAAALRPQPAEGRGRFPVGDFALVPELGVTLGCQLSTKVRAFAGYNFIYWNNVSRPGDQFDFGAVTAVRAPTALRDSDMWVQGVRVGIDWRY